MNKTSNQLQKIAYQSRTKLFLIIKNLSHQYCTVNVLSKLHAINLEAMKFQGEIPEPPGLISQEEPNYFISEADLEVKNGMYGITQ